MGKGVRARVKQQDRGSNQDEHVSQSVPDQTKTSPAPSNSMYKYGFFLVTFVLVMVLVYPEVSQTLRQLREVTQQTHEIEGQISNKKNDSVEPSTLQNNHKNVPILNEKQNDEMIDEEVPIKTNDRDESIKADKPQINEQSRDSNVNSQKPIKLSEMGEKVRETEIPITVVEESKKEVPVPLKSEKTSSIKKKKSKDQDKDIPQEIRDFEPTYLKDVKTKKIFADGRRIPPMELLPQKPNNSSVRVWLFDDFLSEAECDGLMNAHNKHVEEQSKTDPILCFDSVSTLRKHLRNVGKRVNVTPRDFTAGTTCVNASFSTQLKGWLNGNWSYSTAFYPGESRFASIFAHRINEAMGLLPENGGKFQITSYPEGIGYKTHTDCVENSEDKRDRVATVLVYLQTVEEGGQTEFPELGIWVKPRKARALVWNNMNDKGDCEKMSVHQAARVQKGHKYIIQRWYYYKSFYSLGKRPPTPHLPNRDPDQPRVSCDEYENGSCRWYDEWNFDHIVEYERQKYTLV